MAQPTPIRFNTASSLVSHDRFASEDVDTSVIAETKWSVTPPPDVEKATAVPGSSDPLLESIRQPSSTLSSPSASPSKYPPILSPAQIRQPVNAFFAKMRSALSDLSRKPPSSIASDTSDDADKDSEVESVLITESYMIVEPNGQVHEKTADASPSSSPGGLAKRISTVLSLDGLKPDVAGQNVQNAQNVPEERVMEDKIVREIVSLFRGDAFFFSYEHDITTSVQRNHKYKKERMNLPLWKLVQKEFWWNEHMSQNLIEQKLHSWILPVMQGFVQVETCEIENLLFDFILISRRSRERAGLRYHRRGINEQGYVANFVETEQILATLIDESPHLVSYVQARGSIPVFWSQSPYSLKPKPVLERSEPENKTAFSAHFSKLTEHYGRVMCINLTELTGREAIVANAYRESMEKFTDENTDYVEFDFHKECKGMRYENIAKLINRLEEDSNSIGYYWHGDPSQVHCEQTGVFRTNCMDCLDRTNVVQSALARQVLVIQLLRFGVPQILDYGVSHYDQFENIFNDVWANNGDSISREYAGTSALKGDFTRTGKRNIQGVVNDASNSLARMYQNTFKDFFRQATIDYVLGHRTLEVFQELQRRFETSDPGDADRWAKIRATAIEISSSIVIVDNEEKINGWTFLSPVEPNARRGKAYEEKVVLLTNRALYVCTFHYRLEKIVQYVRISLGDVSSIEQGEYILTTLHQSCTNPEENYGFLVNYRACGESTRVNSGSMRNSNKPEQPTEDSSELRFMAFKAFRRDLVGEATKFDGGGGTGSGTNATGTQQSSQKMVNEVVTELANACRNVGCDEDGLVVEKPIISLAEATRNTGIMTRVGFKVKQALWL